MLYALAILHNLSEGYFIHDDLSTKHPAHIIEWLKDNSLLIPVCPEAEGHMFERRIVLGRRAANIINGIHNFDGEVNLLRLINEA